MKNILKSYLKRLTNLTARNRSLVLLRLPQRQFFDVHSLDFLLSKPSFSVIEQLLERQATVPLCDFLDPRDERTNERSKQLAQLGRTEKLIIEERGAEDLFVGYPIVKGKFANGTVVRCPLLFFPVSLVAKTIQKNNKWCLEQRESGVVFNRSFLLAYAHFNNITISDEWLDFSFEDFPKNALEFRTQLYETLKHSPLEINFNQELFHNQLVDYEQIKKQEIEDSERNGELKLYTQAVIGIFPQAGSYIAADYEELLNQDDDLPIDFSEFFGGKAEQNNKLIKEEHLLLPLPVDASQEETIKQAKLGRSMVVQGPPGTGKSQLIANLIADFTAHGKRVLVVCQKRAALDTVYNRLAALSISPFMALLHDFKNDRNSLFKIISEQIENIDSYEKKNNGLDTILLEREFDQTCREIDRTVRELDELKTALFAKEIAGISVKEMYLRLAEFKHAEVELDFSELYHFFRMDVIAEFLRKVSQYEQYQRYLNNGTAAAHFWAKRRSAENWKLTQLQEISAVIRRVHATFENVKAETERLLGKATSLVDLPKELTENLEMIKRLIVDEETLTFYTKFHKNTSWKAQSVIFATLHETQKELTLLHSHGILPEFIDNPRNAELLEILKDGMANVGSFGSRMIWKNVGKYRKKWKQLSTEFGVQFTFDNLSELVKKIERSERFSAISNFLNLHEITTQKEPKLAILQLDKVLFAKNAFEQTLPFLKDSKLIEISDYFAFCTTCDALVALIKISKDAVEASGTYLTTEQVLLLEKMGSAVSLITYLEKSFDFLIENDQLLASFSVPERQLLSSVTENNLSENKASLSDRIECNLLRQWLAHVETQHPILRGVSTLKVSQLENDLQANIQKKQGLCEAIVLMKLREATYKKLEKNRLGNVTTYRELGHQVTKKRQLWSVRKLIENFADELYDLIPCWLASPETVSAIYPLKNQAFDLVIFDEASQCYIEHGLPAALRGKQVIIAGDSQQLQPSDLYQIRYEEETDEEQQLLAIDSLLDVATQYLPQTQLRGHYRSKSLDLIAFSNQHFYKNTLHLLPDYQQVNEKSPSIHYVKASGIWENNQNVIEAELVIEIIRKIDQNNTIGVVTFNYKQAELIVNLLGNEAEKQTNVRVKNIENIQGDEFDVVVFSVGYAPNKSGKLLMNFGTLNQQGGENRLNVAVTRAREKIYVVASILPQDLSVEHSQNNGPKLLQNYLQFALEVSENRFEPTPYFSDGFVATSTLKKKLKKEIQNADYELAESLPFADLAVLKNGSYESLILTDDGLYFDSPSSKDTHGYLPILLQRKGWKYERKWSRDARG